MSAGDGFDLVFELPYGFYGKPFSGFGRDPWISRPQKQTLDGRQIGGRGRTGNYWAPAQVADIHGDAL